MKILHKAAELIFCQWPAGAGWTQSAGAAAEDQISRAALGPGSELFVSWEKGSVTHKPSGGAEYTFSLQF